MRYCSLGSGSTGNATLIEARDGARVTRLLVDCGFSLRELTRRLAARGVDASQVDAVFVTHEHGDHVGCARAFARRHGVPLYTSAGTWAALDDDEPPPGWRAVRSDERIAIGALELRPFAVPHDAREPLQLTCHDGHHALGILTDVGDVDLTLAARLGGCDGLLLECNHDVEMLEHGPYPPFLRRRIAGPRGHLANTQAAALLGMLDRSRLRRVVAAHLSQHNNRPALAAAALAAAWDAHEQDIVVADARDGCPWIDLTVAA